MHCIPCDSIALVAFVLGMATVIVVESFSNHVALKGGEETEEDNDDSLA